MVKKARRLKAAFAPRIPSKAERQLPLPAFSYGKINSFALGYTLAILFAVCMLAMSVLGLIGYGVGMIEVMQRFHWMYNLSWNGILVGMAEAALFGLVVGFAAGWLYNKFA